MFTSITTILAASAVVVSASAIPSRRAESASVTPHEQYSSSIGVLGCLINTNRVAYWPFPVNCDDICVKVTYEGRSLNLLKIDTSGGAFDISYDAWNQLAFGTSAKDDPHYGGGLPMEYEFVDPSECADLLPPSGKLPITASNGMNYWSQCNSETGSWGHDNIELINILDPVCHYGFNEVCEAPDLTVTNQPTCPHTLGLNSPLDPALPVKNIEYGTGREYDA